MGATTSLKLFEKIKIKGIKHTYTYQYILYEIPLCQTYRTRRQCESFRLSEKTKLLYSEYALEYFFFQKIK